MTPVVFDTNVISETVRPRPDKNVMRFIGSCSEPFLSAVTLLYAPVQNYITEAAAICCPRAE